MNRRSLFAVLVVPFALVASCGGSDGPTSEEHALTLEEATQLASVQYDNLQDAGARFEVATAFLVSGDTLNLQGVVDWEHHVGYALAVAEGAEQGVAEVFWDDSTVLERRPGADALLESMGYTGVRYFARALDPENRQLDRALAIVMGLASTQRDNPALIQQKQGSAFLRTDTLRGSPVQVMRYGDRNVYWIDTTTNRMLRFEGNAEGGGAPTVVDIVGRGAQQITPPADTEVVVADSVAELYDALVGGGA